MSTSRHTPDPPAPSLPPEENAGDWDHADLPTLNRIIADLLKKVRRPPAEDPRGLLPTPPIVKALVAREVLKIREVLTEPITPEARQGMIDRYNLSYYFENRDILFRHTPQGVEVLAVGMDEIMKAYKTLSPDEHRQWISGQG